MFQCPALARANIPAAGNTSTPNFRHEADKPNTRSCSSQLSKTAITLTDPFCSSKMGGGKHVFQFGGVHQHSFEAGRMTKPDLPFLAPRLHCQATRINFSGPNVCPAKAAWSPFHLWFCRHEQLPLTMIVDVTQPLALSMQVRPRPALRIWRKNGSASACPPANRAALARGVAFRTKVSRTRA